MIVMPLRSSCLGVALIVLSALFQGMHASTATATPIQHVIIIMQENHTFDNYFGTYPTANGTLVDPVTSHLARVNGLPDHTCLHYSGSCLSPHLTTSAPSNPVEGQTTYENDYLNSGTGFPNSSGPQSMVYFDYHTIAAYWDYAEEFGIADNYFASVLSTTTPNRLTLLTGDSPVSANYGPPPYVPYSSSLMEQLDNASVSWGYYDFLDNISSASEVYPLNYTAGIPQSASTNLRDLSTLTHELTEGTDLPSVSFVNSLGYSELTEHPPFSPSDGESWVVSVINQAMSSAYWPTTAIFLTWDEGGGFYDHVVPPVEFGINHGFTTPLVGLGQRVPLLVISPFAKQNYVSSALLSHLSLLHFVEYNWHLSSLTQLVDESNLPLDFFDFEQLPRGPILVNSLTAYPITLQSQPGKAYPTTVLAYAFALTAFIVLLGLVVRRTPIFSSLLRRREVQQ